MNSKIKNFKSNRKQIIQKLSTEKLSYVNFKLIKAQKKLLLIEVILYITGILIMISIPFTIVEQTSLDPKTYVLFLFENVVLVISPIFFGFCLFKIIEWRQEYKDLIESNINYNIDFIKVVNWHFRKLLKIIEELEPLSNDKNIEEQNKIEIIYEELDNLIDYVNEYSHFNSEKFGQQTIFFIQREWYKIIDILNTLKQKKIKKSQKKINELNEKIKILNTDYDEIEIVDNKDKDEISLIEESENPEYEILHKVANCIKTMNVWMDYLKKILDIIYSSSSNDKIHKNNYKSLIKYYLQIISHDNIKYIYDNLFFSRKTTKNKKQKKEK